MALPCPRFLFHFCAYAVLPLLLGCPDPFEKPRQYTGPDTQVHLLNLHQGKMLTFACSASTGAISQVRSPLDPPTPLQNPKTVMLPRQSRGWMYFLETPAGVPSYVAYWFSYGSSSYTLSSPTPGNPIRGAIPHPGGSIQWLPGTSGALGLSFLAWGSEAPYLVGYQANDKGQLSPWTGLPELNEAPLGLALRNDVLYLATQDGALHAYRLYANAAPVLITSLESRGPLLGFCVLPDGLLLLRKTPAVLDFHPIGTQGIASTPSSSAPVIGEPLSLGVQPGDVVLVTSTAPQAVAQYVVRGNTLRQQDRLVALRGDFQVFPPASPLLLDVAHQHACWMQGQSIKVEHFAIPQGPYAPVQITNPF